MPCPACLPVYLVRRHYAHVPCWWSSTSQGLQRYNQLRWWQQPGETKNSSSLLVSAPQPSSRTTGWWVVQAHTLHWGVSNRHYMIALHDTKHDVMDDALPCTSAFTGTICNAQLTYESWQSHQNAPPHGCMGFAHIRLVPHKRSHGTKGCMLCVCDNYCCGVLCAVRCMPCVRCRSQSTSGS